MLEGGRLLSPAVEKAGACQPSSPAPVTVRVGGWLGGEYLPRNPLQIQLRSLAFLEIAARPRHLRPTVAVEILGFSILGRQKTPHF